jgi:ABC-2 type transport system ATP-binding protein
VSEFSLGQPSLDEVFFALTGHPPEAMAVDAEAEKGAAA